MTTPTWIANARTGKTYRHRDLTYYACEGLIAIHDDRDDSFRVVPPAEFHARKAALVAYLRRLKVPQTGDEKDQKRALSRAINDMQEAIREAKVMGDPGDPEVQAFWRKHKTYRGKVVVSLAAGPTDAPELPATPLGNFTGRTAPAGQSPAEAGIVVPRKRLVRPKRFS